MGCGTSYMPEDTEREKYYMEGPCLESGCHQHCRTRTSVERYDPFIGMMLKGPICKSCLRIRRYREE